jgi:hypothetical protein
MNAQRGVVVRTRNTSLKSEVLMNAQRGVVVRTRNTSLK